jgi:hypothetical protein
MGFDQQLTSHEMRRVSDNNRLQYLPGLLGLTLLEVTARLNDIRRKVARVIGKTLLQHLESL